MDQELESRILGDFIVREKLSEGGFGKVYRAEQLVLEREAVIKVLDVEPAQRGSSTATQRFLREAKLASRLDHPYAAHIYAFGAESDGLLWIAMEMVHGTPLDRLLDTQGRLPVERFSPLLDRIAEVVYTAHHQGIVHRDIKPANVMVLSRAGQLLPKLLDFGIARLLGEVSPATATLTTLTDATHDDAITRTLKIGEPGASDGKIVGTPQYMAPELIFEDAPGDARSDLYALGVLAYESITGRLPFPGPALPAIAYGHLEDAVPPLGDDFPPGLDAFFARALAKKPADRFADGLELADAFRISAGVGEHERPGLPVLHDVIYEASATLPQPIAEAAHGLGSARQPERMQEELAKLLHTSVRYTGLLALSCWRSIGDTPEPDTLRALRRRALTDEEWIDLARDVCRPYAAERDAFPIPELVGLFFAPDGTAKDPFGAPLDDLHAQSTLLRTLSFLGDYRLAVPRGEQAELWMGAFRQRRPEIVLRGASVPYGNPVIVDRSGVVVVPLWPLVEVAPPTAGAPEELFLLDGLDHLGARMISLPLEFEHHSEDAREWLGQLADEASVGEESAPYRGLSPFTPADARVFHGRERETEAFVNRLRIQPLIAVVGPSGAGKSSFVQAGVIPALPTGWKAMTIRPGPMPLASLNARLMQEGQASGDLRAALQQDPRALAGRLRALAPEVGRLLLVVDQLEELFTLCKDPAEQQLYAEALSNAARSADEPVRIVFTIRDDFLVRAEQLPALRERLAQGLQLLTTPLPEDLLRILCEPARRAGYAFEDDDLPREMVQEVLDRPGALAMLSFSAAKLWDQRDKAERKLLREAYTAMGGVGGALAQHAEETLARMTPTEQRLVREAFRHLVTAEGTRAVMTHAELLQILGTSADVVIEMLINARLLESLGDGSVEVVHEALINAWPRLVVWRQEDADATRLLGQLRSASRQWEDRGRPKGLLWRDDVLREYEVWRSRHSWPLTRSEEAFAKASLVEVARGRRARRLLMLTSIFVLGVCVLVLWLMNGSANRQARRSEELAADLYQEQGRQALLAKDPMLALAYFQQAYEHGGGGPTLDFLVARAARPATSLRAELKGHTGPVWSAQFASNGREVITASFDGTASVFDISTATRKRILRHGNPLYVARPSPDGTAIVTAGRDPFAVLWSTSSDTPTAVLLHGGIVYWVDYSHDGRRLVTASADRVVRLWDAKTGVLQAELRGHEGDVTFATFTLDDTRIVSAAQDRTARVWDTATGRQLARIDNLKGAFAPERYFVALSPAADIAATAVAGGKIQLWRLADGETIRSFRTRHDDGVAALAFSRDGRLLLTVGFEGAGEIWDTTTGDEPFPLAPSTDELLTFAAFSPDGARILVSNISGTSWILDSGSGETLALLPFQSGRIQTAAFAPDGSKAVTASFDGLVRIWDTHDQETTRRRPMDDAVSAFFSSDGRRIVVTAGKRVELLDTSLQPIRTLRHRDRVVRAALESGSGRLAAACLDGTVTVWNSATGEALFDMKAHEGIVYSIAFGPDGTLLTGGADGTIALWDGKRLVKRLPAHKPFVFSGRYSPDGTLVATAGPDRTIRLWRYPDLHGVYTIATHAYVFGLDFRRDSAQLVSAGGDGTATNWDVATGRARAAFQGHHQQVTSAVFSPDGGRVLTASMDGTARIWDAETGKVLHIIKTRSGLVSASFDPSGRRIVGVVNGQGIQVWDEAPLFGPRFYLPLLIRCLPSIQLEGDRIIPQEHQFSTCAEILNAAHP